MRYVGISQQACYIYLTPDKMIIEVINISAIDKALFALMVSYFSLKMSVVLTHLNQTGKAFQ